MTVLAVDTTSRDASAAVLRDGETALECRLSPHHDLSSQLVPTLDFLLRSLGLSPERVDLFAAAVGPGLFTGIRVGLATLKGMNFAAGRPMVGVSILEALAWPLAGTSRTVVPVIGARREQLYVAAYVFAGGGMTERLAPCLLTPDEALGRLAPLPDKDFVGAAAEDLAERLLGEFPGSRLACRPPALAGPVGRLALERFRSGRAAGDPAELRPLYLRQPDAENPGPRGASRAD